MDEQTHQGLKVRFRILQVLGFAKSRGWRSADPPAANDIRKGLAKQPPKKNFRSMPWQDVPQLYARVAADKATPARLALLFTILTAQRQGQVRLATWSEFDFARGLWFCPAEHVKTVKSLSITLSPQALDILNRAKAQWGNYPVAFPSPRKAKPLTDAALGKALGQYDSGKFTVHGFRSSFRTWAAESAFDIPGDVAELALGHVIGSKVERAYQRSDMIQLRRDLLDRWGRYVSGGAGGDE